jgi:hypothetical protein
MTPHHSLPVLSAGGNREERTAQIDHIQERFERIHPFNTHIAAAARSSHTLARPERPSEHAAFASRGYNSDG